MDPELVDKWMISKKHVIGLVELYAVVLARSTWSDRIAGKKLKLTQRRKPYFLEKENFENLSCLLFWAACFQNSGMIKNIFCCSHLNLYFPVFLARVGGGFAS